MAIMTASSQEDQYVLGRGISESLRLDAQHLLWRMYLGHVLHPRIPITGEMKIAELGTGTGVWVFDAARTLPSTVQLWGFDISNAQFPDKQLWPKNVNLGIWDSLTDPPSSIEGQFDVIHLRMWASNLRENNTAPIMQHIWKLLKPGGWVQWEDADLINQEVSGEKAEPFASVTQLLFKQAGLEYEWVSELPTRLALQGFEIKQAGNTPFEWDLKQLCTSTYLMALAEIFQGIQRNCPEGPSIVTTEHDKALHRLIRQCRNGMIYNWTPVTVLAQKTK